MTIPFSRRILHWLCLLPLLCLSALPLRAETWFIAPPSAAQVPDADGSRDMPFPSLANALTSGRIAGGDALLLLAGEYGEVVLSKVGFDTAVTIAPDTGERVHLTGLTIDRSRNLIVTGLHIWPLAASKGPIVKTDTRSLGIVFRDLDIRGREDAETYPGWIKDDWITTRRGGVLIEGPDSAILTSRFTGLAFAIGTTGARARVEGNIVRGFSGDGARVLGDGSVFARNRIEDCVQVDDNHADGFQSWSRGPDGKSGRGTVHGMRIEANIIREWAHSTVSPLRCSLQGIGLFDGMYEDLIIRNNLVEVSAPHGISVAGGKRVEITNNTVINNRAVHPEFPWIDVPPHKNGTPSRDVLIANNIATVLQYAHKPEFRITAHGNLTGTAPARIFVDQAGGDFRPRPGGPAEGRADPTLAPSTDLFGQQRDAQPDIGAIEFR